jgi:hypothetical protein
MDTDLLALLPEKYRRSYTMIYDSDSIQDATPANPRVVLYGRLAKFILTFNGDPSQVGYDRAEILQFRDDTQQFELRKITFTGGTATISDANPAECVFCHGTDPRPFWSSYNNWPGVFGSQDDNLYGDEVTSFASFIAMAPHHDRYKNLVRKTDISASWPYRVDGRHVDRTNDRFGRLVGGLAAQSSARSVLNSPFYQQYPNSFLYHFLRCDTQNSDAFLAKIDSLFQAKFPPALFPQQYSDLQTMANAHDQATYKLERLVLNQGAGSWDLSVGFRPGGARFTPDGFNVGGKGNQIDDMIATRIFSKVAAQDNELKKYFSAQNALQNYDSQNGSNARENLGPYGISELYDDVDIFMDLTTATGACPVLANRITSELGI